MAAFIFLFMYTFMIFHCKSSPANGHGLPCSPGSPSIQLHFPTQNQEQENHTHPLWEIACMDNITTIHFSSYGDLMVKAISYETKRLNLIDPKNCVHGVFLNLDLTSTPFSFFYALKNYTYINCSISLAPSFSEIPCLSSSNYHVYTVEPSLAMPGSCSKVKTVPIPFSYNPYISDNSFGLRLTWSLPRSEQDALKPGEERPLIKCFHITLFEASVLIFCFILITLVMVRLCQLMKIHDKGKLSEAEKLLGQYITLYPTRNRTAEKIVPNESEKTHYQVLNI